MFDTTTPGHPHPAPAPGLDPGVADRLPADAYYHLVRTLRLTLPPPPTDSPGDLARRDHAAIARIAALAPTNAAEAELAAQFVAASEQWKDCLKLAQECAREPNLAHKCRAQALGMMRHANSALRLLLRMQAVREKRERDQAAADRAAWTEHRAIGLMAEALPPRPEAPPTAAPAPPPVPPGAAPAPAQQPDRPALIRRIGRLPDEFCAPSDAKLVQALLANPPALAARDARVSSHDPSSRQISK